MLALALLACRPETPPGTALPVTTPGSPPAVEVTHAPHPDQLLARRFEVGLTPPDDAVLVCAAGDGEEHALRVRGGALDLWGLLADTTYGCELRWRDEGGAVLWAGAFATDPLPEGLPTFARTVADGPSLLDEGYVLTSWWRQEPDRPPVHLLVIDAEGRIRWLEALPEATKAGVAAEWTGDAVVLGGGQVLPPTLVDLAGRELAAAAPAEWPDRGWHHEAKLTPEGWLLGLQAVPLVGEVAGFRVDVTDPGTGEVRWSFDAAPLVDAGALPPPAPGDDDPYHANAVSWVDDLWGPAVWISLRGVRRILRVDRETGEVTTQLGLGLGVRWEDPEGRPLGDAEGFTVTHDPEITGDHLLVFDNGGDRPGGGDTRVSSYRLLAPDRLSREWSWSEPGWFEPSYGSVQTLADGTVLVGSGHDVDREITGGESRAAFVAQLDGPAGRVIRRLDLGSPHDSIYRARFVDGCALFANRAACPSLEP